MSPLGLLQYSLLDRVIEGARVDLILHVTNGLRSREEEEKEQTDSSATSCNGGKSSRSTHFTWKYK